MTMCHMIYNTLQGIALEWPTKFYVKMKIDVVFCQMFTYYVYYQNTKERLKDQTGIL